MTDNFQLEEFNISGGIVPNDIYEKIYTYHAVPMQKVRDELGFGIWPSEKSSYRTLEWELDRGRSGNSQHTYKHLGATDWTCKNFAGNKDKLLKSIIKNTDYKRIAVYNNFIHCDYKEGRSGKSLFEYNYTTRSWKFLKEI